MSVTYLLSVTRFIVGLYVMFTCFLIETFARNANIAQLELIPLEMKLGDTCRSSYECLHYLHHSHCDWDLKVCTCQPYHVAFNGSFCLPASLLGYGCALDQQCQIKVKDSECSDQGLCQCQPNRIPLRKDKCLPPAKLDDFCLNDAQCRLASPHSFCKYIIPRVYGKCRCPHGYMLSLEEQCLPHLSSRCQNDAECREVTAHSSCQRVGRYTQCICDPGFKMSKNKLTCEVDYDFPLSLESNVQHNKGVPPVSLGRSCLARSQCQARDPHSDCINGVCECIINTPQCSSERTGCLNDTFQCITGQCISWYFVCDGERNCDDGSDEDLCVPFACPKESFQCNDGTCMSRSVVCNGRWECPDGSDEARCYKGIPCDKNSFRCANGQCLPQYAFCNAVIDCYDGSDESYDVCEKGLGCPENSFKCYNNRCRSSAILCSGLDGCGDNSDENECQVCHCEKPQ